MDPNTQRKIRPVPAPSGPPRAPGQSSPEPPITDEEFAKESMTSWKKSIHSHPANEENVSDEIQHEVREHRRTGK